MHAAGINRAEKGFPLLAALFAAVNLSPIVLATTTINHSKAMCEAAGAFLGIAELHEIAIHGFLFA